MKQVYIERDVELLEDVKVTLEGFVVTMEGKKGKLIKDFENFKVELKQSKDKINVKSYFVDKKKKAKMLAVVGYLKNMMIGVTVGYTYKSKIIFSHFPITVEPDNKKRLIIVKNLYGGRKPLVVPIVGDDTTVKVDKDDVIIEGINKEAVGQTTANMKEICKLRGKRKKDPETFMDGIWKWASE
ncbi:MAG: 50S ribosomal protein L6 [Candidatus Heimdallarchaeota archaeon]|nr:50S ribosomal protein L6 [Candidatus Heimdallarchaeota archaeon]